MPMALGLGLGMTFGGSSAYVFSNAEAAAIAAAMTSPPDGTRSALIDTLVGALKTAGVWSILDVLYIHAAADSQAARLNWKNPGTFTASVVNAPTFTTDRGFTTDGAASYVNLNFNPATGGVSFTQNSASFGIWSRTSGQKTASAAGWSDGTDGITINPRSTGDLITYRINTAAIDVSGANTDGSGMFTANRSAVGATQIYRNGSSMGTGVITSTAVNSVDLNLGRVTAASFSNVEFAAAFAGGSLSGANVSAFYTAMNTYMTGVGAA